MKSNAKVEVGHCYRFSGPYQWGSVGIVHEIIRDGEVVRIHLLQGNGPLHSYVGQVISVNIVYSDEVVYSAEEIELTDLDKVMLNMVK